VTGATDCSNWLTGVITFPKGQYRGIHPEKGNNRRNLASRQSSMTPSRLALEMLDQLAKKIAYMTPRSNRLPLTDREMNLLVPLPTTDIPREIREQEREIEAILRGLLRFSDIDGALRSEDRATDTREQEVAVWLLIAVLGFISSIGFCLMLRMA
jgi:hypothetical protein